VVVDGVLIDNYVASQDLNECVDALIKKGSKHVQPEGLLLQGNFSSSKRLQLGKRKSPSQSSKYGRTYNPMQFEPGPKVIYYHKMI